MNVVNGLPATCYSCISWWSWFRSQQCLEIVCALWGPARRHLVSAVL